MQQKIELDVDKSASIAFIVITLFTLRWSDKAIKMLLQNERVSYESSTSTKFFPLDSLLVIGCPLAVINIYRPQTEQCKDGQISIRNRQAHILEMNAKNLVFVKGNTSSSALKTKIHFNFVCNSV
ncbi:hypothetical protein CEXT_14701 [Caerostris extrusa]|uniref:Uncharacterized protein n=1 Tax=Caerostris extrusa TaxID=172846 RepID=A0AAV4YA47_CAEEX|nr:hypothetical protein CEXT_14701 [Caerostris extrusa]